MPKPQNKKGDANGARREGHLGFEATLWAAADKLRGNMDAAEYKHVVLGLIFLKYISDAFEEKRDDSSLAKGYKGADPEDRDEYMAENVFWVPPEARWSYLQGQRQAARPSASSRRRHGRHRARQPIAQRRAAQGLRPAAPRQTPPRRTHRPHRHHRPRRREQPRPRTSSGRVYEYFLGQFASAEGKKRRRVLHPALRRASCSSPCSRPTKAASSTPAAVRAACSCNREKFVEAHGGRSAATSRILRAGDPTPPPGSWRG